MTQQVPERHVSKVGVSLSGFISKGNDDYATVAGLESAARTYANRVPRVISRAEGGRLYDTEGNEYLDCLSCAGVLATGHNHPFIMDRVKAFLSSGHILQALDFTTPIKAEFVRELNAVLPEGLRDNCKMQFCGPTGADGVEAAVKLCKIATGRNIVLTFRGGYHGMTAGTLGLTGDTHAKQKLATGMMDVHFMPFPNQFRSPFGLDGNATIDASLAFIEDALFNSMAGTTCPAAVIVEPVQGEGGVLPAPFRWLRGLRDLTRRAGVPLILDEVQTGIGRTGKMFGFEWSEIEPDVVVISKAIGGGFPLSVLCYRQELDKWSSGMHAGTFRGNQIAMAAGIATLEFMRAEKILENVQVVGNLLKTELLRLKEKFSCIGDVRGLGLMCGLEMVSPREDGAVGVPDGQLASRIRTAALERGLLIEIGGREGSVVRLLPPLTFTADDVSELIVKLERAIEDSKDETLRSFL